jgi:ferredoxin
VPSLFIDRSRLDRLFATLAERGFRVVGPTLRDGAIVYDRIESSTDLPEGWTDLQDGGTYRVERRDDRALFGYNVGPHSWKRFLFPPERRLLSARRDGESGMLQIRSEPEDTTRYAFVGVRACELHAMSIQDRVLVEGPYADPAYKVLRERVFVVAVNCTEAGNTCFCASMGTGPRCESGYDLALTEVPGEGEHGFVVEAGSDRGTEILEDLDPRPATDSEVRTAREATDRAAEQMGRRLETRGIKELLYANYEHPRWDDVAGRCLSCSNCTSVCPTCFCTTVSDATDLSGERAERVRHWDSCFTAEFSYLYGGSVRNSTRSRYRQWMTHKLATWIDQFGTSGCVGCGRCITWCPVGIDITEEVRAIRETAGTGE